MIILAHLTTTLAPLVESNLFVSMLWMIAALLLILIEISAPGFYFFLSFASGCLVAALCAFYNTTFLWQIIAWLAGTTISFLLLKQLGKNTQSSDYTSNYHALIGKQGIVTKEINNHKIGRVKIQGESWAAQASEITILAGTTVEVVGIKGNRVIVSTTIRKESS